jgi:hypothetical protein
VAGGKGIPCQKAANLDYDQWAAQCAVKACTDDGQCMAGGNGARCSANSDCQATCKYQFTGGTTHFYTCVAGGSGEFPCPSDTNIGDGCKAPQTWCFFGTCRRPEDGETAEHHAACSVDADCANIYACSEGMCQQGFDPHNTMPCDPKAKPDACAQSRCKFDGTCTAKDWGPTCNGNNDLCKSLRCQSYMCQKASGVSVPNCTQEGKPCGNPPKGPAPPALPSPSLPLIPADQSAMLKTRGKDHPMLGKASAQLQISVFVDLECGMCRKVIEEHLPALVHKYVDVGRARIVFFNYPLGKRDLDISLAEASLARVIRASTWRR